MDAVNFVKEWGRMCSAHNVCSNCEAFNLCQNPYRIFKNGEEEELVGKIRKWSEEHPIITNEMKFKEVFGVNPYAAGYQTGHVRASGMPIAWWDKEYKEPKE